MVFLFQTSIRANYEAIPQNPRRSARQWAWMKKTNPTTSTSTSVSPNVSIQETDVQAEGVPSTPEEVAPIVSDSKQEISNSDETNNMKNQEEKGNIAIAEV